MNIAETLKNLIKEIWQPDFVFIIAGVIIFGKWLLMTSLGRDALSKSRPHRNNMPAYLPFAVFFGFFFMNYEAVSIITQFLPGLEDWQNALLNNAIAIILGAVTIIVMIIIARAFFARRLKGFGLNPRTIGRDFGFAIVNLIAVWPLIAAAFIITTKLGEFFSGPEYQIPQHKELELLTEYQQAPLVISIIVLSVVIAPVFEELIFRGLFQSLLRSITGRPWLSILIISILFAMTHMDTAHWPALMILAICLGYSYEKSGSLFRPIFIHALFNGISVLTTLLVANSIR